MRCDLVEGYFFTPQQKVKTMKLGYAEDIKPQVEDTVEEELGDNNNDYVRGGYFHWFRSSCDKNKWLYYEVN